MFKIVFTLGAEPSLLQGDAPVKGRPKSSEILEELWNQGIIPVGESWGKDSGPAFCIMDEPKGAARRPPARLKSLKARKDQSHSKEDLDEKMRLVEERRKFKQDELKTRLRTSSARGRRSDPTFTTEDDTDPTLSPVESLHLPPISEPSPASPLHSQMAHKAAMGGQWVKEAAGDNGGFREGENASQEAEEKGDCQEGRAEEGEMEEEEVTQVEELRRSELLAALEELESDSSFQHAEDKDETF
ncbi:stathmin domain-containing protein 1 [Fundulus heteroclitus]|uniref:stathmin domain-containing protein 1 n=1 Tax=Fundulus heteroclitus TaxID=8078 RepID=UPI00165A64BC|nr:stathmin domain-containing protein 1 [Fundulus heteroclitus]